MRVSTLVMDDVCDELASGGSIEPINLSRGVSNFDTAACLALSDVLDLSSLGRYGDSLGEPALRYALARFYAECYGLDISPDRFCVADGASGALTLALFALLERDGELLVPAVTYPLYRQLAEVVGARTIDVPLGPDLKLDLDALERRLTPATRAIVINTPANPFGSVYSRAELDRLASLGVPLVSDEVYHLLCWDGPAPTAAASPGRTFVVGSFSKSFALPGLRIGYVIAPEAATARVTALKRHLNFSTSLPSQAIATAVLGDWSRLASAHRAQLRAQRDAFVELAAPLDCLLAPPAGFFGVLDLGRHGLDSRTVARALAREHAVAVAASTDFVAPDGEAGLSFLRVNYCAERARLAEALGRIERYLAVAGGSARRELGGRQ